MRCYLRASAVTELTRSHNKTDVPL